jgi:hypothetical protein
MSNYHSFGDIKFVPDLPAFEVFTTILYSHPNTHKDTFYKMLLDRLLPQVDKEVFNRDKPYT